MKTYTIEQIKKYITKQDSLGDVLYNLNERNIDKAQKGLEIYNLDNGETEFTIDDDYIDDGVIRERLIEYMEASDWEFKGDEETRTLNELLFDLDLSISN